MTDITSNNIVMNNTVLSFTNLNDETYNFCNSIFNNDTFCDLKGNICKKNNIKTILLDPKICTINNRRFSCKEEALFLLCIESLFPVVNTKNNEPHENCNHVENDQENHESIIIME